MNDQPADDHSERSRSNGRYVRANTEVEHDAEAARLRGQGLTYRAIAKKMGTSVSVAHARVQSAFRATLAEPAEQARAVELARLEDAHDHALAVLLREHLTVSHGKIIVGPDGNPLIDDGPILQAIDRIRALSESRRKLLGLDAPSRVSVDAEHLGQEVADLLNALTAAATTDTESDDDGA